MEDVSLEEYRFMKEKYNRRAFFARTVVASGAAAGLGMSFEEKALLARQAEAATKSPEKTSTAIVPKGKIGDVAISRVIVGSNLFYGGAHARNLRYVSELMERYFTREKIMDTLELCEKHGITTNIGSPDIIAEYNKERGGNMQAIGQLDPRGRWIDPYDPNAEVGSTKDDIRRAVDASAQEGSVGAFLLGCRGDRWVNAKRFDLLEEFLSRVRENGMIAGIGGHDKRVPMAIEKEGLDLDFYFKTIHPESYWGAIPEEEKRPFVVDSGSEYDNDCMWELYPQDTIEFMKAVKKPWIGYKVLAAGAVQPKEAFRFAFENGTDFICPGMFDWQVQENAEIACEVLADDAVKNRARPWRA
jgi:hypothetical protein